MSLGRGQGVRKRTSGHLTNPALLTGSAHKDIIRAPRAWLPIKVYPLPGGKGDHGKKPARVQSVGTHPNAAGNQAKERANNAGARSAAASPPPMPKRPHSAR
eukprot:CAMPEP_0179210930 /NCGR_PEP_ID=MMETSP0797-20121207/67_1 /TAXON_ID=47934 /ORGANISM="Dinophysis acuminata, Strain DAEP01" /LENGTH=101 /DNA_ID=CAMNT_0020915973 /DNA_START=60 /DNA_END=362 /DNA_ORIENTATION=-